MPCPQCSHENPAGARFCNGCGGRLETVCTGCGQAYKVPDGSAGRSTKCRKCGTVVNILAVGLTGYLNRQLFATGAPPGLATLPTLRFGDLSDLPRLFALRRCFFCRSCSGSRRPAFCFFFFRLFLFSRRCFHRFTHTRFKTRLKTDINRRRGFR